MDTKTSFDKPETETWRPKQILSNHKQKNGHQSKLLQTGNRHMETRTYFDKPETETWRPKQILKHLNRNEKKSEDLEIERSEPQRIREKEISASSDQRPN